MTAGSAGNNWSRDIFNRWTPTNSGSQIPRVQMNDQTANESSTRWLLETVVGEIKCVEAWELWVGGSLNTGLDTARLQVMP